MTTWTPRPPAPDEPACWSWPIPAAVPLAERFPGLSAGALDLLADGDGDPRWDDFHAGRCAICAIDWQDLVDDHDHDSGQERGKLCRSCNTREGVAADVLYDRYRAWHPAAILDHHRPYSGRGWVDGRSLLEHGRDVDDVGIRPPTPWTAFDPANTNPKETHQ